MKPVPAPPQAIDQLAFAFPPATSSPPPSPAKSAPAVVVRAQRLATGELRAVSTAQARAAGFRWPLVVTARLWVDVETVPGTYRHREAAPRRWHDVLLLAAAAAAQLLRREGGHGERAETSIKVILHTTTAPERSHEHLKTLRLTLAPDDGDGENFTLGYGDEVAYRSE